ncbi:MAG: S41 family peptidase [Acidobacteriota bacterium]|nr:S41 family peptidase [Blastocatellia bacterium]MDW8241257.1 S41 family peptidase [Acidobacteriota bacterium]
MNRITRISIVGLLIASLACATAFSVTGRTKAVDELTIAADFAEAVSLVETYYADSINYEEITKMAILGMLHTLDPHSSYYDRREFTRFRIEQTSQYFGIGATIGARNGKVFILAPFADTPAYRAGLRYGDQIVAIDGESTETWSSTQVSSRLRGPRGTPVEVRVQRAGEATPRTFKLTRDAVPLPSISGAYFVRPGIGYINFQLRGFNTTTDEEMNKALKRLESGGLKALIIDMRSNPGGLLDQAVKMAEKFLFKGQLILTQKSRSNKRESTKRYESQNPNPLLLPLVVIVNGGTASAAEIVTAAIQEHDRGMVVGEPTFGKALVQTVLPLSFGAGLTLTTAKYLTPSGRSIQRAYTNLSFYDYYFKNRSDGPNGSSTVPTGPAFRTDAGRTVYGEGGITPDVAVPATQLTEAQSRLQGAIFAFTRELVAGLIPGLESYRVSSLTLDHTLGEKEYRISDQVLQAFTKFATSRKDEFRLSPGLIESNKEFIRTFIRYEVVTAAYGLETAAQALNDTDIQLLKAIEVMPKAAELANTYRTRANRATAK